MKDDSRRGKQKSSSLLDERCSQVKSNQMQCKCRTGTEQSKAKQSRTEQIKPTGLDIKQHKAKRNRHRKTGGAADLLAVLLSKPCPSGCSCWLTRLLLANQRFWRSEAALLQSRRVSPAVGEKGRGEGKKNENEGRRAERAGKRRVVRSCVCKRCERED